MAIWPLYHFDATVSCFSCGKLLKPARDGEVIGFGEGNGNRFMRCSCGFFSFFDTTKNEKKAQEHMEENASYFTAVLAFGGEERKPTKGGQVVTTSSAFDLPASAAMTAGAFDLGTLITQEVRRQK